jgi:hypothetical protein
VRKQDDDHLLACQQIFEKEHKMTRHAKERASFLKINDINDISFYAWLPSLLYYSVSGNAKSMGIPIKTNKHLH